MKSKTESSYLKVLKHCMTLLNLNPCLIITDMELALFNSLRNIFPCVRTELCLFHFGQAIWRRLNELRLSQTYRTNVEFKKAVKMCVSLTFVSTEDVLKQFIAIKSMPVLNSNDNVKEFVEYFERTYIGRCDSKSQVYFEPRYCI
jgi:hypothetical protein